MSRTQVAKQKFDAAVCAYLGLSHFGCDSRIEERHAGAYAQVQNLREETSRLSMQLKLSSNWVKPMRTCERLINLFFFKGSSTKNLLYKSASLQNEARVWDGSGIEYLDRRSYAES